MDPTVLQIVILGLVQGAAELLPVSSSAHVIVAEKLMHLDPSSPEMTFLIVMLHTGTMAAVIAYFWKAWKARLAGSPENLRSAAVRVASATIATVIVAWVLKEIIEEILGGHPKAEVEELFSNLTLIGVSLAAAGLLIIAAGLSKAGSGVLTTVQSVWIGAVQGLCLPFRGFSRSGATISTGMLLGVERRIAEEFSFALAVVLTPAVVGRELLRLLKAHSQGPLHLGPLVAPGLFGMVCSFIAGLIALRLLSGWLEKGRWHFFGIYCFAAAGAVLLMARSGY